MPPAPPVAVLIGYYRYSDIFFEWHQVIPDPAERSALRGLLALDALTHPDHPLRKPGNHGIELFMGIMPNGQSRLLFSSAQVEYISLWLHAVGLTKSPIPIPSSDYLLTNSILRHVSPVVYGDAGQLKKALRIIEKNNKRLKGTDSALTALRQNFERVRTFFGEKRGAWLAVDFEAWEMDHTVLLEFGWSSLTWSDGQEVIKEGHIILKDNTKFYNGKYVANNRENFEFGTSEQVNKATFQSRVQNIIDEHLALGPLFLVFHDNNQDIKYLRTLGVSLTGSIYLLPEASPDEGIYVIDTSEMFQALQGETSERKAFKKMCSLLRIRVQKDTLHNAGNDAHYTMIAMKSMASGKSLDLQREDRWPDHVTEGSGLMFSSGEEDGEFSDEDFPRTAKVYVNREQDSEGSDF